MKKRYVKGKDKLVLQAYFWLKCQLQSQKETFLSKQT